MTAVSDSDNHTLLFLFILIRFDYFNRFVLPRVIVVYTGLDLMKWTNANEEHSFINSV